ncbi:hypothetical protein TNCT_728661 [Trichonephila clavata]|uniref:Uncharacterized protein n=1 Tax=Trichonephila clavata TaxID=2740835 RepID=A0A8X6EZM1_TRICU|nr:hypothetical protein TNCT_728661 [Trichonephila clavata]
MQHQNTTYFIGRSLTVHIDWIFQCSDSLSGVDNFLPTSMRKNNRVQREKAGPLLIVSAPLGLLPRSPLTHRPVPKPNGLWMALSRDGE